MQRTCPHLIWTLLTRPSSKYLNSEVYGLDLVNIQPEK